MPLVLRALPQTNSHAKLDSVYGCRQPGYSPHPVLLHRQSQRNELQRSLSAVLGGLSYKDDHSLSSANDPTQASHVEWGHPSVHAWPATRPALLEELPPRLDDCRKRIACADRELDQFQEWGQPQQWSSAGFQANKLPVVSSESNLQEKWMVPARKPSPKTVLPPVSHGITGASMSEPAPEPALDNFSTTTSPRRESTLHRSSTEFSIHDTYEEDDEMFKLAENDADLSTQLAAVEDQLRTLGLSWESNDCGMCQHREKLAAQLVSSAEEDKSLGSQLHGNKGRLNAMELEAQSLSTNLGVSEGEVQTLRGELSVRESRVRVLHSQINALHAQLYNSQSEMEGLLDQLEFAKQGQDSLVYRIQFLEEEMRDTSIQQAQMADQVTRTTAVAEAQQAALADRAALAEKNAKDARALLEAERVEFMAKREAIAAELAAAREKTASVFRSGTTTEDVHDTVAEEAPVQATALPFVQSTSRSEPDRDPTMAELQLPTPSAPSEPTPSTVRSFQTPSLFGSTAEGAVGGVVGEAIEDQALTAAFEHKNATPSQCVREIEGNDAEALTISCNETPMPRHSISPRDRIFPKGVNPFDETPPMSTKSTTSCEKNLPNDAAPFNTAPQAQLHTAAREAGSDGIPVAQEVNRKDAGCIEQGTDRAEMVFQIQEETELARFDALMRDKNSGEIRTELHSAKQKSDEAMQTLFTELVPTLPDEISESQQDK